MAFKLRVGNTCLRWMRTITSIKGLHQGVKRREKLNMDMIFSALLVRKRPCIDIWGFKFEPKAEITVDQTVLASYITAQTFTRGASSPNVSYCCKCPTRRACIWKMWRPRHRCSRAAGVVRTRSSGVLSTKSKLDHEGVEREKSMDFLTTVGMLRDRLQLDRADGAPLSQAYFGPTCKALSVGVRGCHPSRDS